MEYQKARFTGDSIHNQARDILSTIRTACNQFHITSLNRQIQACESLFVENPIIDVAILGQFKAGKSSFINSLIGKPILPVGVIPVTTVITRLQYGPSERAMIRYFDEKESEVTIEEIDEFISEAKNPANKKNVEFVDIEHPALKNYAGLRFVDTPGLGSVFKYNTAISEEWLPNVGTAIVAISSDRPLSENDLQLIRELMEYTPKVVLLLTKVDLLSPEQQGEVVKFFKETLKRELNRDFQVLLYSTVRETEVFQRWLDHLLLNLSKNRDAEFRGIFQHKIRSLVRSCIGYLDIALKTSLKADRDREELKKLILDEKVNYDLIQSELFLIARENKLQTRTLIATYLENTQKSHLTATLHKKLSEEMPTWNGNLWKLTRKYEEWLMEILTEELGRISKNEYKHFFGTLKKAQSAISRSVALFRNLLDSNIEKVLGIRLSSPDWVIEVSEPSHPDVGFTKVFDFHFDLLWFLIPMCIFRGVFEKHFQKQIPRVVEIHLSRLAYQWEVRINKVIEEMKNQALQYVHDEIATIDALLSQASGQTDTIKSLIRDLQEKMEALKS